MKKRTVFIGAILSLISIGQPLIIKSGVVLSTTSLMLALPQKVNAKSADKYFDIAYEMGNSGDYEGAIKNFSKVIELKPNDYLSYMNRGWNKAKLGDYYAAISDYNKSIRINPNNALAFNNRGYSKVKIRDYKGAISDYNKAIEIDPKNHVSYQNRGNAKTALNDHYGAISDYIKAIEINPKYEKAYVNRGRSFYSINDKESACKDFKKAVFLGSNTTESLSVPVVARFIPPRVPFQLTDPSVTEVVALAPVESAMHKFKFAGTCGSTTTAIL